jgi:hypothetical protein
LEIEFLGDPNARHTTNRAESLAGEPMSLDEWLERHAEDLEW